MPVVKIPIVQTAQGMGLPVPAYESAYHAGIVLYAAHDTAINIHPLETARIPTGFAIALPDGLCAQIVSDPAMALQKIVVLDAPALVNPADRQPLGVSLFNASGHNFILKRGTPIARLIFMPYYQITWDVITSVTHKKITSLRDISFMDLNQSPKKSAKRDKIESLAAIPEES